MSECTLLPLSQAEQIILFTISKLGSTFTFSDIRSRVNQYFKTQLTNQAILVNFRVLRSRGLINQIGTKKEDKRIKLYCMSLQGLFLVVTVSGAINMDEKNFSMTDIRHRRGIAIYE